MEETYIRLTTLVFAIFCGVSLSVLANHLRIPAIAPLLVGGVVLGPEVLGLVDTHSLGDGLRLIISLSVAIILFEGGLTLKEKGFRKAQGVILRLLTVGVLTTWLGTAAAVHLVTGYPIPMSVLAGSLVIVTGPTVINPLLQRIKVKEKLHHILHWEGVLIDPIGVFIGILCFEWLSIEGALLVHFEKFALRLLIGVGIGFAGGYLIYRMLKRRWIPEDQSNIFVFGAALFLFGISDMILHEAGILTVVITGLVLGIQRPEQLKDIQQFKSELTEIAIAILFILLAANLELKYFYALGWKGVILMCILIVIIRPLGIFLSALGSDLTLREKLFLSWVAPRGVVAGSMASLFTLRLSALGWADARFLEAFTFMVIAVTIFLQGFFSNWVAKLLGVNEPRRKGWLIVGAHYFARKIAGFIEKTNKGRCILVDTNSEAIYEAQNAGLTAYPGNALSLRIIPEDQLLIIGNVLALTDNRHLNQLICEKWSEIAHPDNLYRWSSENEEPEDLPRTAGRPVWTELSKPSKVAFDLTNKNAILVSSTFDRVASRIISETVPLIAFRNDHANLIFPKNFDWSGDGQVLLLQRLAHYLPFFIQPEHIVCLQTTRFEELLIHLVNLAQKSYPELPLKETLEKLMEGEKILPTTLGNGVAVPHARCPQLKESVCLVARVSPGIDLHAHDGKITRLFFLLLSAESDPTMHLRLLADIAKIASDESTVQQLLTAESGEKFRQILVAFEKNA